jgi:hypothetical protein
MKTGTIACVASSASLFNFKKESIAIAIECNGVHQLGVT